MKFLVLGVVLALVMFWLLRPKPRRTNPPRPPAAVGSSEPMLQCAECGTHFPASEAVAAPTGLVFCSQEHRLRHAPR